MKTPIGKNERVLNLLALLLSARQAVSWPVIRREVDGYNDAATGDATVARRFERDKETLRALGVEIVYGQDPFTGVPGYLVPKPAAYMGEIELTGREVRLLMVLSAFSRGGAAVMENLAGACQKLLAASTIQHPPGGLDERHLVYPAKVATNKTLSANLEVLALAVEKRQRLHFTYYSIHRDATSKRTAEPYGLKFFKGEWYVVARCADAGEPRIFRLDRIKGRVKADAAEQQYEVPKGFSLDDYVGRSPWQLSRRAVVTATLVLDDTGAWLIEEARPAGLSLARTAKGATATVEVRNEEAFFKWLVSLGTHVKITAPRDMAGRYVQFIGRLVETCRH